jgi:hypothetical protein
VSAPSPLLRASVSRCAGSTPPRPTTNDRVGRVRVARSLRCLEVAARFASALNASARANHVAHLSSSSDFCSSFMTAPPESPDGATIHVAGAAYTAQTSARSALASTAPGHCPLGRETSLAAHAAPAATPGPAFPSKRSATADPASRHHHHYRCRCRCRRSEPLWSTRRCRRRHRW